jgi:hypothetical protein
VPNPGRFESTRASDIERPSSLVSYGPVFNQVQVNMYIIPRVGYGMMKLIHVVYEKIYKLEYD